MKQDRDLSFDAFRGIAIIAVVAIHAIYIGGSPNSPGFICHRQFLNFAVPAFFFMSGYWASKEQISSFNGYKAFLKRRLPRIIVPYLFWSLASIGFTAFVAGQFDGYGTIFKLLTGGACMGYYFIIVLIQLHILTPVLMYLNRKLGGYALFLVFVFNMAVFLVVYLSRLFRVIGHVPIALPFCSWVIYYEMGLFISDRFEKVHTTSKKRLFILPAILLTLIVSIIESGLIALKFNNPEFATFTVKYSSFLYSICVIFGFIFYRQYFARLPKILCTIGYYSFGIYLIHMFVLSRVVGFFQDVGVSSFFQPLYQLVLVVTTLAICFVLIGVSRKLLPEFVNCEILGFGTHRDRLSKYIRKPAEQMEQAKVGITCEAEEA